MGKVGVFPRVLATSLPSLTRRARSFMRCVLAHARQNRFLALLTCSCTSALVRWSLGRARRVRIPSCSPALRLDASACSCLMLTLSRSRDALLLTASTSRRTSLVWWPGGRYPALHVTGVTLYLRQSCRNFTLLP